mgnify:CR=1 FL=1
MSLTRRLQSAAIGAAFVVGALAGCQKKPADAGATPGGRADSAQSGGTLALPVVGQAVRKGDLILSVVTTGQVRSEALAMLKAGADFAWLARTRSTDDLAEKSGQLGWVSEDRLSPTVAEAVEGLKVGGLTGVVAVGKTFTILKVEEREEPQPIPLDQVRREVQADLYRAELEKSRVAVAAKLREGSQIQVSPDALVRLKERCFPADSNESLTPKPHP